ncbi:hypothetical protein HY029_04510 [Candidatus Gottesmanbacteria bacterium]|nr:hypothetical protein [Candidatus Gottesmanbacteria bacterium]
MITGLLIISIISFIAVISYKRPRMEQKVFKNIPLVDWLNILGFPPLVYLGLVLIVVNIVNRPIVPILDFEDFTIITVGIFFLMLAFVGQSIHFVSKVISRYLPANKHALEYQVNEIFHGKLSHYMVIISALLVVFILDLLEINHPVFYSSPIGRNILIIIAGVLMGFAGGKSVIYTSSWHGGYYRPIFSLVFLLFLSKTGLFYFSDLHYSNYPMNLFSYAMYISIMTVFILRQFIIFSKLSEKRRLRFIAKLFSL